MIISGKQSSFPLNQIFRSFRNEVQEWYRNLHAWKVFGNPKFLSFIGTIQPKFQEIPEGK